jgi:hypothetical protein
MQLHELDLLGIDVGYSKDRASTGIARCGPCGFASGIAKADWESRSRAIGTGAKFHVAAIDGPLVALEPRSEHKRECEYRFIRKPFHQRCKPGLSHSGQGLQLRRAASDTLAQIVACRVLNGAVFQGPHISTGAAVVEAFPNGFLGVLLPEDAYAGAPRFKRGKRFDWLYEQAVKRNLLLRIMQRLKWRDEKLIENLQSEAHHEKRAALICLLTAGCAASRQAVAFGDERGGWFWLPPFDLWAEWARGALEGNRLLNVVCSIDS